MASSPARSGAAAAVTLTAAAALAALAWGTLVERTHVHAARGARSGPPRRVAADPRAAPLRPAHGAVAARQAGVGALARRPAARPRSSTPATTSVTATASTASGTPSSAFARHPRCLRQRLERLLRPRRRRTRSRTSPARRSTPAAPSSSTRPPARVLRRASAGSTSTTRPARSTSPGTHLEFFGVDDPHKQLDRLELHHRRHRRAARRRSARRRDLARPRRCPGQPVDGLDRRDARAVPARAQLLREPRRPAHPRRAHPRRSGLRARASARS